MAAPDRHVADAGNAPAAGPVATPAGPAAISPISLFAPAGGTAGPAQVAAVLALQRGAGNQAVQRALSRRTIQRDQPKGGATVAKPAGPTLPPGRTSVWMRRGMAFWVLISKQWLLDRGVAPDAKEIREAGVMKDLLAGLPEAAPWVDLKALEKHPAFSVLTLAGKLADEPETIVLSVKDFPVAVIGNPPGEQVSVRVGSSGADIWIDAALIQKTVKQPDATGIVDAAFTAQVFGALEAALGETMGEGRDPGWRAAAYARYAWRLPAPADKLEHSAHLLLEPADLVDLFGEKWQEKAKQTGKPAGRVQGASISLPPSLQKDWPQIMEMLKELVGPPRPDKPKDEPTAVMPMSTALMLLKLAKSPLRERIVARIKAGGGDKKAESLGDMLESLLEDEELKDFRKRHDLSTPGTDGEEPVLKRPVHGDIVLTGGRPVPHKEAVFTFQVTDDVDAFRAPLIQIQWYVFPKDKPEWVFDSELNTYSPLRGQGPINDKLFEVTFPKAGTYVVEASVHHNFYRSAVFRQEVKVLTEQQEADFQEKSALAGFAAPGGGTTKKHDFDVGDVTSAVTDYGEGTVTRGKLDPKFKTGTLADRLKAVDGELARVEKLLKSYENRPGEQAKEVRDWAEDYLKTLREGRAKVEADAKDSRVVACSGVYVSRSKKAPSKSLDLVCLQKRNDEGGYHVSLHDLTQVYEQENYHYEADAKTAEAAYEKVFVEHAESYPDGTLSVAFQGWDEAKQAPTGEYVKFRKVTDTIGKDVKTNVFDPAVNIVVNLTAAVMMVVPGLQAAGFGLMIVWNGSQTIMDLEEKAAKGTLKDKDLYYAGASFALDLLPVVGTSERVISLGRKVYYVIEVAQWTGQVMLVAAQGAEQIEQIRNGVISELAKINDQIEQIERVNPSDPQLDVLRAQQDKLVKQGEDAVIEVYGGIVAQQGLMMVAGHVVTQAAAKKFTARIGELETMGRFRHEDGGTVRYDFKERKIVGDREKFTQAQLETAERVAGLSEKLEGTVPDPALRERIVSGLGDGAEIVVGGKKTHVEMQGDKKVLHVAEGAAPHEIVNELEGAKQAPGPKAPAPDAPPAPQFGLDAAQTKKLLDTVTPEQAKLLHEFLGPKELGELASGQAGKLKRFAEGVERAKLAAAADPRAAAGLERLGSKQHEKLPAMGAGKVADILADVPPGRMELFLRAVADPDLLHPRGMGPAKLKRLADSTDRLGFISEFGAKAYNELDGEKAFEPLLKNLRDLDPEAAHALVEKVRAAKGERGKLKAAGEEPPEIRPRRATGRVGPDKADTASWDRNLKRAKEFAAKEHDGVPYTPTDEQIEMLATMYQLREKAPMNRKLSHDKRVQMLDEFDQLGREAGLKTQWINNLRGGLSESLFSPSGGANKTRLPNPDGGFTILDYAYEPATRPGTKTGRKEWVEQKSDLITAPPGSDAVFAPAVGRARRYVADATLDMKAVAPGDTILIDFVRKPGNAATETAMLDVLFAEGSPIQAVKFGDGAWFERTDHLAKPKPASP